MADIDISKNHTLGKAVAKEKATEVINKIRGEIGLDGTWNADIFTISKPVKGSFTVTDTAVRVQIELGFAMRMIKGKIEERIRGELTRALG
jgi:putative polyhydroxyalkanoate system protein